MLEKHCVKENHEKTKKNYLKDTKIKKLKQKQKIWDASQQYFSL